MGENFNENAFDSLVAELEANTKDVGVAVFGDSLLAFWENEAEDTFLDALNAGFETFALALEAANIEGEVLRYGAAVSGDEDEEDDEEPEEEENIF